ncbi:AbrB/MazE/SpoVT family DNA-binding domain-containing protein [Xenorhabdus kozodoii]|uniref:MazE protein n=1 Tax=Xenorhabdus kozodoii TaxID=351676 RepID=A0A2D0LGK0_9GAMM|nr:AbrB/MazE/SpoVT family DNA-binding domain-containing protein [Xenorhabdus kozodoii]PHM74760.1 MazE protein [Xenorhabdus kozodoii]
MRITIKKWGNSAGVILPATLLAQLKLNIGQDIEATVSNDQIVLKKVRKKYRLDDLIAKCDPTASPEGSSDIWPEDPPVGHEVW